jgi:hypothetical protein
MHLGNIFIPEFLPLFFFFSIYQRYIVVSAANFNIKKPPFFEELLAFKVKGMYIF